VSDDGAEIIEPPGQHPCMGEERSGLGRYKITTQNPHPSLLSNLYDVKPHPHYPEPAQFRQAIAMYNMQRDKLYTQ